MIEIAAILSPLVRDWADLAIIIALLIFNALVGFWEEYQAGNAIAALKAQLAFKARVKQDNNKDKNNAIMGKQKSWNILNYLIKDY